MLFVKSTNRVINDESTIRERLPLGQFLDTVETKIVGRWSKERRPGEINSKKWYSEPVVSTLDYTKSYQWISEQKEIYTDERNSRVKYFVAADEKSTVSLKEIDLFLKKRRLRNWKSFESYVKDESEI